MDTSSTKKFLFLAALIVFFPSCAHKKHSREDFSDFTPPECSEEIDIEDLVYMEEPALDVDDLT